MTHRTIEASGTARADGVRFRGVLYSGGVLRVPGYDRGVVIALDSMKLPDGPVPLVTDHASGIAARLGHARILRAGDRLLVEGEIVTGSHEADRVAALLRSEGGISLSIGARPGRVELVKQGAELKANGQSFAGPIEVARDATVHEVSVVGIPADATARAIAAQHKERNPMDPTTSTETPPSAPVIGTVGPVESERARIREIMASFRDLGADAERDRLIESGASTAEANLVALRILRASRPSIPGGPTTIAASYSAPTPTAILAAGAARLLGAPEAAIAKSKLPADVDVPESLYDLAQRCVRADGREVTGGRDGMIRAAFSSDRFTGALASALSVIALDRFSSSPEAALQICKPVSVSDFREQTLARLDGSFQFKEIPNSGELKHALVDGKSTTFRLGTHGVLVQLTRQDIINDERGMLQQIPSELGAEAARTIGDKFAEALIAGSFFDNVNGNLLSGAGSALQLSQLTEAVRKLRVQTGKDGRALNLAPKYLLVPPALEATARQLLNSMELGRDDGGPTANPMQGIAQLLVDARLVATNWYIFSAPENGAAILATLNGKAVPTIEAVDLPSDRLGVGWRGYHDFAIAMHEPRAAVRSIGA